MRFKVTLTVLAAALVAVPTLRAATNDAKSNEAPAANAYGDSPMSAADTVLADLHRINLTEIDMGKLAQDNSKSAGVKKYGEMLVNDHKKADKKVSDLADQLAVKLPDEDQSMAAAEHGKMDQLKQMKGAAFDKAFTQAMAEDHQKAIASLEAAQSKVTGPTATLVAELLPILKQHEKAAKQLAQNPAAATSTTKTQ